VEYSGDDLPNIGVLKNDRLDTILGKLNLHEAVETQAIATESTDSVELQGNGVAATPLKAVAKLDDTVGNILKVTAGKGLGVFIDKNVIQAILEKIAEDTELMAYMCEYIVKTCTPCTAPEFVTCDSVITIHSIVQNSIPTQCSVWITVANSPAIAVEYQVDNNPTSTFDYNLAVGSNLTIGMDCGSLGEHTIKIRVKCAGGAWSNWVSGTVTLA
jgi:hypothetical protein